jgi:Pyruvate/2-oxoacid:ferredoxin oxidoreductase gamma subunit
MLEVRIHGRGGQGVQVACQILAGALFRSRQKLLQDNARELFKI